MCGAVVGVEVCPVVVALGFFVVFTVVVGSIVDVDVDVDVDVVVVLMVVVVVVRHVVKLRGHTRVPVT